MKNEIEIKNAAKYLKVSKETFNKFLDDCSFNVNRNMISIDRLNKIILKMSLKNLNKGKQK